MSKLTIKWVSKSAIDAIQTLDFLHVCLWVMKSVFVTVGTTSFDELIENITSSENVQVRPGY